MRRNYLLVALAAFLLAAVGAAVGTAGRSASAQEGSPQTLQTLLTRLNERAETEGLAFTISLIHYSPADGPDRVIGSGDLTLSEIGADYLCIERVFGANLIRSCYPYSGIAAITTQGR